MYLIDDSRSKLKRRVLRNRATEFEKRLWRFLRKSYTGYKFRRQISIGPYIVDFYCPEKRLIVEIDGGHHNNDDARNYDRYRTKYFESLNMCVLRFWNSEVENSIDLVLEKIKVALRMV